MALMLPRVMPLEMMVWTDWGKWLTIVGYTVGVMAKPRLTARMMTLRSSWKSTRRRVWMPITATVPNRANPAPPSTGGGIAATIAPTLGMRPMRIMNSPAVATTQRLLTLVSRTSPTFSAKQV